MKFNIHGFHFDVNDEVRNYAVEKIGKLDKYYRNIIIADVKLEAEEGDTANVRYICTVQLEVPGDNIVAKQKGQDIHEVIDLVADELKRQISKKKEKENPKKLARAKDAVRKFFGQE